MRIFISRRKFYHAETVCSLEKTLQVTGFTWWSDNARLISVSGKLLGAHVCHAALIILWCGTMTVFEVAHYIPEKPLYEQELILIPHVTTLGWGVDPEGEIRGTDKAFIVGILHLVSSWWIACGGLFHTILGPDTLEEEFSYFGYDWRDKNKMTTILAFHLILLGFGSWLLVAKDLYFGGIYDTWATAG